MKPLPCLCLQGALSVLDKSSIIFSLEHWECQITIRPKVICILLLSSFQPSVVCTCVLLLIYSRFCLLLPCTFIFSSHASLLWWDECQTKFTCKDSKDNKLPHALNVGVCFCAGGANTQVDTVWRTVTKNKTKHTDRHKRMTHKQVAKKHIRQIFTTTPGSTRQDAAT